MSANIFYPNLIMKFVNLLWPKDNDKMAILRKIRNQLTFGNNPF